MILAEFLTWGDGTDTHYELVRGQIVAMASPAERHGTIIGNLGCHLANRLTPPCRVVRRRPAACVVSPSCPLSSRAGQGAAAGRDAADR